MKVLNKQDLFLYANFDYHFIDHSMNLFLQHFEIFPIFMVGSVFYADDCKKNIYHWDPKIHKMPFDGPMKFDYKKLLLFNLLIGNFETRKIIRKSF